MRKAVIDIGTNTINLLVASQEVARIKTDYFERIPARLGEGGMMTGVLTDAAMSRGLQALFDHLDTCKKWGVELDGIKVTATSAVRSASNRQEFLDKVLEKTGLSIEVIDGDREAELIWKGVRLTGLLDRGPALIMDIGGGSTEFILADAEQVGEKGSSPIWAKSYDLGVTRIKERFQLADPFSEEEELHMREILHEELMELWEVGARSPSPKLFSRSPATQWNLIGASGSFDSIDLMLANGNQESLPEVKHQLDIPEYKNLSEILRRTERTARAAIPGLIPDRVDTMPYSAVLIDMVIEELGLEEMWRSSYALKEGVVSEVMG